MAGRQDWEGGSGTSKLTKQILGLATGAALGYVAYYGASKTLRYLERSGSSRKPKEIGMSAPPAHKGEESSSKSQSYAAASKEDEPKRATASEPHDDKDGKVKDGKDKGSHAAKPSKASAKEQHDEQHGKDKGDGSHAAEPSDEPLSTIVQEEKVPEPGFDAPEDKMQDIGMSWRNNGNEIIIEALCPKELQPKDLKCTFTTNTLILEVAGKEIATGKLFAPIKPDESTWQFGDEHLKNPQADSKSLTVTLTKSSRKPWKDLFQVAGPQGLE
ncbi:g2693 [Coccomyxa viridis]|uniref:G2693 protein n=1 Tax=Coccomyxa viridis TaxID=1274662 RepID=A0ABP1FR78_9CHLO